MISNRKSISDAKKYLQYTSLDKCNTELLKIHFLSNKCPENIWAHLSEMAGNWITIWEKLAANYTHLNGVKTAFTISGIFLHKIWMKTQT